MVDGEACTPQPFGQAPGKIGIILDQKDADGGLPSLSRSLHQKPNVCRTRYQRRSYRSACVQIGDSPLSADYVTILHPSSLK
jgi:hypothetical protein